MLRLIFNYDSNTLASAQQEDKERTHCIKSHLQSICVRKIQFQDFLLALPRLIHESQQCQNMNY